MTDRPATVRASISPPTSIARASIALAAPKISSGRSAPEILQLINPKRSRYRPGSRRRSRSGAYRPDRGSGCRAGGAVRKPRSVGDAPGRAGDKIGGFVAHAGSRRPQFPAADLARPVGTGEAGSGGERRSGLEPRRRDAGRVCVLLFLGPLRRSDRTARYLALYRVKRTGAGDPTVVTVKHAA